MCNIGLFNSDISAVDFENCNKTLNETVSVLIELLDSYALDEDNEASDCIEAFDIIACDMIQGNDRNRFEQLMGLGLSGEMSKKELDEFMGMISIDASSHPYFLIKKAKQLLSSHSDIISRAGRTTIEDGNDCVQVGSLMVDIVNVNQDGDVMEHDRSESFRIDAHIGMQSCVEISDRHGDPVVGVSIEIDNGTPTFHFDTNGGNYAGSVYITPVPAVFTKPA